MRMSDDKDLRAAILAALAGRRDQGMRRSDLRREVGSTRGADAQRFRDVFRDLCAEGVLIRQRGGRYVAARSRDLVAGTVQVSGRGFGFVTPAEPGGQDIFIPPQFLNGAISGDRVLVSLCEAEDERGPVGRIERVTERVHRVMVASLVELPAGPAVRPLRRELPPFILLAGRGHAVRPDDIDPGDWVEVCLTPQAGPRDPLQAVILRRLAAADPITADLDAVAVEFGLPEPYTEAEQQAAEGLTPQPVPREDATGLTVVTIDPLDAKDFDDGISLEPGPRPGTVIAGVHIADVAVFVPPGSPVDEGARRRGFTSYLPGRTLPMLPRALSSWQCSLIAGQERLAHSVFLEIDESTGEVLNRRRARTRVRVSQRLTFEGVGEILARRGRGGGEVSREAVRTVLRLGELAERLRSRRAEREAFLDLAVPEVRVLCGETPPRIHALQRVECGPAHALVEEFMLAANTAVAEELLAVPLPAVFRNHAEPRPVDLAAFADWARQTLRTSVPALRDREAVNRFIGGLAQTPLRDAVLAQFLRALPRAGYAAACRGHYGLGKLVYCHFTSPIRRYPDLVVHQQLLAHDLGRGTRSTAECEALGETCSALEEQVDSACYAAVDRLKLRYLRDRQAQSPGEVYEGMVSRCTRDGLTVYLPEVGMYGGIALSRLPAGPYRIDQRSGHLRASRGGKSYKPGDVIYVQCRRADTVRGELTLEPVQGRV